MAFQRSEAQVMERIRRFLNLAESSTSESEREQALDSANKLMAKHAIDQAMLDMSRTSAEKRHPVSLKFEIFDRLFEWADLFGTVMQELARTNRCRTVFLANNTVIVVGMQEDVEWVQLLWMNVFFEFVSKINPSWKNNRTMGENVLAFKEAGYKWETIWTAYFKAVDGETIDKMPFYDAKKASYLMREYKKELVRVGREAVATQRHEAYRVSFSRAFTDRLSYRLELMRAANKKAEEETTGSTVALLDVSKLIDEEWYKHAPWERPITAEERQQMRDEANAREAARQKADEDFLASLSPAERKRVIHEREVDSRKQARQNESYWRQHDKKQERLRDDAGFNAGRAAADTVSLSRNKATSSGAKTALEG